MNYQKISSVYTQLRDISNTDADIIMSEKFRRMLEDPQYGTDRKRAADLLLIQIAAADYEKILPRDSGGDPVQQYRDCLSHLLRYKLRRYSETERITIMTEMIRNAYAMLEYQTDESFELQLTMKSYHEIEEILLDAIDGLMILVTDDSLTHIISETEASTEIIEDSNFSSGAFSCAVYVSEPEIRAFPEAIGTTSSVLADINTEKNKDAGYKGLIVVGASIVIQFLSSPIFCIGWPDLTEVINLIDINALKEILHRILKVFFVGLKMLSAYRFKMTVMNILNKIFSVFRKADNEIYFIQNDISENDLSEQDEEDKEDKEDEEDEEDEIT